MGRPTIGAAFGRRTVREVLILGNGISRLLQEDRIRKWNGELWACNNAYREWGEKITRLTGHHDVLGEALAYRKEHGHAYEIWTGSMGRFGDDTCIKCFTCPPEHRKDSGTTLIAQAFCERVDRAHVCGFDFGGRDIYTVQLHTRNKDSWMERWRAIRDSAPERFDRMIEFVGYDHLPAIRDREMRSYRQRYRRGLPHIPDPDYIALFNLLYGVREVYDMGDERMVDVRYLAPHRSAGWETRYRYDIAKKLEGKGELKILDMPEEATITETPNITTRMTRATVEKIARLRGIENPERYNKRDIVRMLKE